jgi:anti-sigma-K factor RskA
VNGRPDEHSQLQEQIGVYLLGALPASDRSRFEAHLAVCAECAAEARAIGLSLEAIGRSVAPIEPPRAVRKRVLRSVSARMTPSITPWLATAAAIALAIGLGIYAGQLRNQARGFAVLAARDVAHIELKGQPAAPQASARASWSRSRGLVFLASALPSPPAGRTYQLWILTARTPPISESWLLTPDARGNVIAIFKTPSTLPAPVAMAVTLEPAGGVPAPTGAKYLVGSPD